MVDIFIIVCIRFNKERNAYYIYTVWDNNDCIIHIIQEFLF